MSDWRDIATAPKDGTEIIGLGFPPGPLNGHRKDTRIIRAWRIGEGQGWSALNSHTWFTVGFEPTHWMPLPARPVIK